MRQIVLDTETTGIDPRAGNRIIEIGCVEIIDRRITRNYFHTYINPEYEVEEGALKVHGLSNAFLEDKPLFSEIIDDFLAFLQSHPAEETEFIIHNAPFDTHFLNHEFARLRQRLGTLSKYGKITDTLTMARKKHPGQRNNLDALTKRYDIKHINRELHGALLDAQILALVYLAMTGGQSVMSLDAKVTEQTLTQSPQNQQYKLKIIPPSDEELALDGAYFE